MVFKVTFVMSADSTVVSEQFTEACRQALQ